MTGKTALLAFLGALFFSSPVLATGTLDISTGLKTLLLINDRPQGAIEVGVVFDHASASSQADAESIKAIIDNGSGVPSGLHLSAKLVDVNAIADLAGTKAAFLADGLSAGDYVVVSHNAVVSGILTISTDLACVESGHCVLGIVSTPRVEIYYNPAAAEASHISFSPAFLMLVKQI